MVKFFRQQKRWRCGHRYPGELLVLDEDERIFQQELAKLRRKLQEKKQ